MTTLTAEPLPRPPALSPARRTAWRDRVAGPLRLAIGVLLCLTPLTAVLVLGWLMRLMQAEQRAAIARRRQPSGSLARAPLPRWLAAEAGMGAAGVEAWLGSLWANLRLGLAAGLTLALGTLPFSALWLLSWWAGWENSFNKGYEQAWVGPSLGLLGVAISLPLLARLPMALAHQAAEGRIAAFFAWRDVRRLMRAAGWRYVGLGLLTVLAAMPLSIAKVAPTLVEHWRPGFAERTAPEVAAFVGSYGLGCTVYLLACLVILRRMAARLHARAVSRLDEGDDATPRLRRILLPPVRTLVLWLIWLAFVAQVYVGQFMSHHWLGWIAHPLLGLPWLPRLGSTL